MTNKEIVKEMFKMVSICGSVTMQKDDKWVTIAQLKKEDVEQIEKDLDLLDLYKKFFKYSLTEIQGIKYLVLPNSGDIRRPDSMIKITDEEYELLKVGLENEKDN